MGLFQLGMLGVGDRFRHGLDFVFVEAQQHLATWTWKPELEPTDLTMGVGDDAFVDLRCHLNLVEIEVVAACTACDRKCATWIRIGQTGQDNLVGYLKERVHGYRVRHGFLLRGTGLTIFSLA